MSKINYQALRERYSPQPVPKCHICGAEMTIQRMSASRIVYGCTGTAYDDKGCHYAEGRSIADEHYAQSRVTIADFSDPEVLMLLDELEARGKRIAELEAREVKLPKPISVLHRRDFNDAHRAIYAYPEAEVNAALAAAGIGMKEDKHG